ncbi:DNA-binding protein [Thermosynechococcus sichuanensis E542]|uniref:DNA-binding protein n=1 Tax=Thermosynechococcus sichuanensis E542 TaxID=2016101 RepID=A0A3B7MEX5_9CYAN|nr:DNA-binding protein [Thermosynechococcus vestitus]AXY67934.1 DNA-binding protein [Thermosynechococcus vestitus E542]
MKHLWSLGIPVIIGITGIALPPVTESLAQSVTPIRNLSNFYGVTIRGTVRSVVGNEFILDDGTGQVIVDAGPRWFHQINLQPGETVTVVGKYDDYDFDAFRITRANGEVINIRPHGGPPPWAGGRRRWQQRQAR